MADITYCLTPECPFTDCERHCDNAPRGVPVSLAHLAGTCRRYIGWTVNEVEKERQKMGAHLTREAAIRHCGGSWAYCDGDCGMCIRRQVARPATNATGKLISDFQAQCERDFHAANIHKLWVRTNDKLPETSGEYLVVTAGGNRDVLLYSKRHRAFNAFDDFADARNEIPCTYWMPLPAMPEVEV